MLYAFLIKLTGLFKIKNYSVKVSQIIMIQQLKVQQRVEEKIQKNHYQEMEDKIGTHLKNLLAY